MTREWNHCKHSMKSSRVPNAHIHLPPFHRITGSVRLSTLFPVIKLPSQEQNLICPSAPASDCPAPAQGCHGSQLRQRKGESWRRGNRDPIRRQQPSAPQVFSELSGCDNNLPSCQGTGLSATPSSGHREWVWEGESSWALPYYIHIDRLHSKPVGLYVQM